MLPTIGGRYQTRTFLVLFIGVPWTLLITPLLPGLSGLTLGQKYTSTFVTLGWVLLLGYLWEPLYHYIQYQRWEKDWPILFAFLVFINEGILVWVAVGVLDLNPYPPPFSAFLIHFLTTWILQWLYVVGPIRAVFYRHRFNGAKFFG